MFLKPDPSMCPAQVREDKGSLSKLTALEYSQEDFSSLGKRHLTVVQ